MRNNKRLVLFLLLTAFSTLVCRCGFDRGSPVTLLLADGNTLECREFYESNPTWQTIFYFYSYDCSIPCPDGSLVPAKEMRLPNIEGKYNGVDIVDLDLATLQGQHCPAPTEVPAETETPTPTPLASTGNVQVTSAPFLTGKITACNYKAGFINFERADAAQEYSPESVQVVFNQQSTQCSVPDSNRGVLSCGLPAGVRFPLNVQVNVEGVSVNDFSFDGSFCGYKDPGAGGNSSDSGAPGEPTVIPTQTDVGP